ncbi:tyrosine-protein phosphatase [Arthrobacter tumbae]|uniref:tyrosine-protein phosphatase n=1 Tax=Arthrobacter tumbae TaxID=163874 RepID=UPI00195918B5|nr:tyrosine-protein phosphatase [Arthrobacter tumbae]MBM7781605.1 protein-tyrosine phosphatase [Arthrobacter tumbae]
MVGILNLRDIAELTAGSANAPARARVYRSSQPFGWDAEATMEFLHRQGIETIVDLRSEREAGRVPWQVAHTAGIDVIAAPLDPSGADPAATLLLRTAEDLGNYYLSWLSARPDAVLDALRPIAEGRTTLVHCAAGKDRTGVITAVVLLVAGVEDELIIEDYAHTTGALPQILPALAELWAGQLPAHDLPKDLPVILTAPAEAMATFLTGLRREHGSVEDYLLGAGMAPEDLRALRDSLRA